jgi:hypothetical protein
MSRGLLLGAMALMLSLPFVSGRMARAAPADPHAARRRMASRYEIHGLVEKAVAEYLKILAQNPEDPQARQRVNAIVAAQMPAWLPEEAEAAAPFPHDSFKLEFQAAGDSDDGEKVEYRLLLTVGAFAAQEGHRWDELHEKGFALVDYAYMWQSVKKRYEVRVAAHWEDDAQTEVAQAALRATSVLYCLTRERLDLDPTGQWGDPVDIWVTQKGEPGARAQGRSIYLYASQIARPPGEWLREVAHEYGHVSFPGIDGFEDTDDPWADGHLAEVLFPKLLAANGVPEWMPWEVAEWMSGAAGERERLLSAFRDSGLDQVLLQGKDAAARDHFLGLALDVEDRLGPERLAQALKTCPQGTALQFVTAAEAVGAVFTRAPERETLGPS